MAKKKNKEREAEPVEEVKEVPESKKIKVRIKGKDVGQVVAFIDNNRVRAGQVIEVEERLFSKRFMERVSADAKSELPREQARVETPFSQTNAMTGELKT